MLTKTDLSEIQKIVHSEIQSETPGIVRKIVQSETPGIVRKIVQEELSPVKNDIQAMKKDINLIVRTFDRDYVSLRKRVEKLETHSSPIFTHA